MKRSKKKCYKCKKKYSLTLFSKERGTKHGWYKLCEPCRRARDSKRKQLAIKRTSLKKGFKICSKCMKALLLKCFSIKKETSDGLNNWCRSCIIERNRLSHIKYKKRDSDCGKRYYRQNKKQVLRQHRKYYRNNKRKIYLYHKSYRAKNKKKIKVYQRGYNKKNPLKAKAINHRRRIRNKGVGYLDDQIIKRVYIANIKKYGKLTCYLCFKLTRKNSPIYRDTLDHKVPLSRGGTNEYSNLAIAHKSCNSKKGKRTEKEYRKWLADSEEN